MEPLPIWEMFVRILMAFVAGFIIGWERESHGRPAGLRTTILACVASAVAMVVSEILFIESAAQASGGNWRPDPARLGAGILTGIGFLGAGTILRHANMIRGVTTAASLWFVTVIGLAFGSGLFALGFIGVGMAMLTLFVLPAFEKHIPVDLHATLSVTTELEAITADALAKRIEDFGPVIKSMRQSYDLESKHQHFICELKLKKARVPDLSNRILADLKLSPGVLRLRWT